MIVVVRRSHEGDVKTEGTLDFFQLDFGEDGLIGDAEGVVATTVEGTGSHATEVTHTGQCGADETHEEVIHAIATKGHFDTDVFTDTQLEVRDGFFGLGDHWLLTCDELHFIDSVFYGLLALALGTDGAVDDNLFQFRHLMDVFDAELLFESRTQFLVIESLEDGGHGVMGVGLSSGGSEVHPEQGPKGAMRGADGGECRKFRNLLF